MKIPQTLKIGGINYQVIVENPRMHGCNGVGSNNDGVAIITISNTANRQVQESTLFHEMIEAINGTNDLQLSHQTISTLETSLYQILRDNDLLK